MQNYYTRCFKLIVANVSYLKLKITRSVMLNFEIRFNKTAMEMRNVNKVLLSTCGSDRCNFR